MTWLLLAAVAGGILLIGGIGCVVAYGLGRMAAEIDQADYAAWDASRRMI